MAQVSPVLDLFSLSCSRWSCDQERRGVIARGDLARARGQGEERWRSRSIVRPGSWERRATSAQQEREGGGREREKERPMHNTGWFRQVLSGSLSKNDSDTIRRRGLLGLKVGWETLPLERPVSQNGFSYFVQMLIWAPLRSPFLAVFSSGVAEKLR